MGLGEGSWDAAPLSGSRGLSSGWAHQSSLRKVSSRISEIMELGVGKGDAMQGRLQSTAQTTEEAGRTEETENSPFTYPCRSTQHGGLTEYTSCCILLARSCFPSPGFRAGRLLSLEVFRTGTCCLRSDITAVAEGRLGFGTESGRVWLPKVCLWNRLWATDSPQLRGRAVEEQAERAPAASARGKHRPSPAQGRAFLPRQAEEEKRGAE